MSGTIGYVDAWLTWFSGQQVPGDLVLWGRTVRWWGRAGKIAAFIGGTTVILDVIGSQRLRAIAVKSEERQRRAVSSPQRSFAPLVVVIVSVATGFNAYTITFPANREATVLLALVAVLLILIMVCVMMTRVLALQLLALTLENESSERALRWTAIALLAVGFHFDLLAS